MADATDQEYYSVAQAAKAFAVSRTTVLRWIEEGRLPAYRLGAKTFRIKNGDVQALFQLYQGKGEQGKARTIHDAEHAEDGFKIWAGYDPRRVKEALRKGAGALAHLDRERFFRDMHAARAQDTRGRPD